MSTFRPCLGKTACQEDEQGCRMCKRSAAEIARTRELVEQAVAFAVQMDYDNVDDFAAYLARRIGRKVAHLRETTD